MIFFYKYCKPTLLQYCLNTSIVVEIKRSFAQHWEQTTRPQRHIQRAVRTNPGKKGNSAPTQISPKISLAALAGERHLPPPAMIGDIFPRLTEYIWCTGTLTQCVLKNTSRHTPHDTGSFPSKPLRSHTCRTQQPTAHNTQNKKCVRDLIQLCTPALTHTKALTKAIKDSSGNPMFLN